MKTLEGRFLQNLHCGGLGYQGTQRYANGH